jgi:hypothetical protein
MAQSLYFYLCIRIYIISDKITISKRSLQRANGFFVKIFLLMAE